MSKSIAFAQSNDLNVPLKVRIDSLEGQQQLLSITEKLNNPSLLQIESNISPKSHIFVSLQVVDEQNGRNITLPTFSAYTLFKNERKWDQWLTLPVTIGELTTSHYLLITLWEYDGMNKIPMAYLKTSLFDENSLKRGFESLKFEMGTTSVSNNIIKDDKIYNNLNNYYMGEFKKIEWLDQLTLKKLNDDRAARKWPQGIFVLNIQFPIFEMPIVYTENKLNNIQINIPTLNNLTNNINHHHDNRSKVDSQSKISIGDKFESTLKFYDPDQFNSDPIEEKYRRLERATKHSDLDKHLKPNIKKRDYLNRIINYPPGKKLTPHEKGSIWKYRYYLTNNKKALTKLLKSTNFNEENERLEVLELMDTWAEIDIDDAIELLGSNFKNLTVRAYAVNRLRKSTDKELELYLLQLVQAVCFENVSIFNDNKGINDNDINDNQTNNNMNNILGNENIVTSEFTIVDEMNNSTSQNNFVQSIQSENPNHSNDDINGINLPEEYMDDSFPSAPIVISPLGEFLIKRALKNRRLGNFFYWYLKSELKDRSYLKQILDSFWNRLSLENRDILFEQTKFVKLLHNFCIELKQLRDTTQKKKEMLNELLSTKMRHFLRNQPIPLPLDPDVIVVDVVPEKSKVFKSSLSPLMITFKTDNEGIYQLMYKVGDDLRQDQLVIQIIKLMDELLKNENVDLKLTPYKTLAMGPQEGAIQFIPNDTMVNILGKYHGILPYLREKASESNQYNDDHTNSRSRGFNAENSENNNNALNEMGVPEWVMDNFIKSCAGYCVITYLLGVGDRHLDNLLITPDGHFFHADFGYILGQDPKPFPPLMKLPPQIIEAFGGLESSNYNKFRSYCFTSYSILRRNAGLILNLFELMKTSNIPDIRIDPENATLKVHERFNLEMSEEEATVYFQKLITDSANALLPIVIDHLHNLAQYWRN